MACSSMHNRFIPDSDSVYLDKSAVSLHDDVVTDGIDVWVTSIHSAHNTWGKDHQVVLSEHWEGM